MECLAPILGSAVRETGQLVRASYPNIKNFMRFQKNRCALEKETKSLLDVRNKLKEEVESSDNQMKQWLREVEEIMLEVNSLQADAAASNKNLCGCFFGCKERYRYSRETARMLKEVERLLKAGNIAANMVGQNYLTKAVEHIPGPSVQNQETASKNLARVMELLNNDDVSRIGVWGMGGVGKTTLVKNLNNKLKDGSSTLPFGIVIWATVSKKLDLRKVQIQIAERLNLEVRTEDNELRLAILIHQRLQKQKFILVLDDVWESIDLDCLGVPQPEVHTGSKIILTSRSLEVCREMMTDTEVKVNVLSDEESWELFTKNAGEVATSEQIEPVARAVARECSGLPLALITVGIAMRGKAMIELWEDALHTLRRSVPDIKGIESRVYKPLKWSYDSLQGKNIKPCFLYCCLYPEDFSIEVSELVKCWLAEGLIDEQRTYEDSYNRGITLIENLKDSCLLEPGTKESTVKMHDVVRDVAIWISSSLEDGCKSLVQSGIGLTQISEFETSESFKRVSFMHNKLTNLPNWGICYPETVTLLLQGNHHLERIPDGFLQAFQSLKILNLSGTEIWTLPQSILQLHDLRVLLLRDCYYLKELPELDGLRKLQVLDCSATRIRNLPSGMQNLSNLRQLYLSHTQNLETILSGIISRLSNLEVLDMTYSGCVWGSKAEANDGQLTFDELRCLKWLCVLSIRLKGIPSLGTEDLTWISKLRTFKLLIGSEIISSTNNHEQRQLAIHGLDLSGEQMRWLLTNAGSMVLNHCSGLNKMLERLVLSSSDSYICLKYLSISNCKCSLRPSGGFAAQHDLLPNLEQLRLHRLIKLESISELVGILGLRLSKLKLVEVIECPRLKYLLTLGGFIVALPNLKEIKVSFCSSLVELFNFSSEKNFIPEPVIPNLRTLELQSLIHLRTLYGLNNSKLDAKSLSRVYTMKAIEHVKVTECYDLRELPLTTENANTIKEIRGEELWWSQLKWEDNSALSVLQPFYQEEEIGCRTPKRSFYNAYVH